MKVVAFDFDGTLTRSDSVAGFYRALCPDRRRRWPARLPVLAATVAARLGVGDGAMVKRVGFDRFLRGRTREELSAIGRDYVASLALHEAVVERLDEHLAAGHRVFVVSASFDLVVEAFRPAATTLATPVRFREGVAVGVGTHLLGAAKVDALRSVGVERLDEAYSDSLVDRPLLRLAEQAFLVDRAGRVRPATAAELAP